MFKIEDRVKEIGGSIIIWHVKKFNRNDTYTLSERDQHGRFHGRIIIRTANQIEKVK